MRLLAATGNLAEGRKLIRAFCDLCAERGLYRALMGGLAVAMHVEHLAGDAAAAAAHLVRYLRLTRKVDLLRPLAREREAALFALGTFLADPAGKHSKARIERARALREQLDEPGTPRAPTLTEREVAIVQGVESGLRNKEIARQLGLSENGVRYHLKNIYRKTGARSRIDAARRAKALGVATLGGLAR